MNNREKFAEIAKALKGFAIGCSMVFCVVEATVAQERDRFFVVQHALTLEQIVEQELNSTRFAREIAALNGIAAVSTVVPAGTTIRVPETYLQDLESGSVVFSKGDVTHAQRWLVVNPPARGARVYPGDVFTTGKDGFVSLTFGAGSVVSVQPDSQVVVSKIQCADETEKCVIALNAEQGVVDSQVQPRPAGSPPVEFTVTTPFLSAAVRGTSFYVNVDKETNKVGVTEGLVATLSEGSANDLPRGKGLLAREGIPAIVVSLTAAPELFVSADSATIFSSEDLLRWNPVDGAENYRVTIATDELMTQPLQISDVNGNVAEFPQDLTPGEYYLSVAGVNDFLGLPSFSRIYFAAIDEEEMPELRIERSGEEVRIAPLEYDGTVELLVRNDLDSATEQRSIVGSLSDGLLLQLDSGQDWILQARKVMSNTSVSAYSPEYLLEAR